MKRGPASILRSVYYLKAQSGCTEKISGVCTLQAVADTTRTGAHTESWTTAFSADVSLKIFWYGFTFVTRTYNIDRSSLVECWRISSPPSLHVFFVSYQQTERDWICCPHVTAFPYFISFLGYMLPFSRGTRLVRVSFFYLFTTYVFKREHYTRGY